MNWGGGAFLLCHCQKSKSGPESNISVQKIQSCLRGGGWCNSMKENFARVKMLGRGLLATRMELGPLSEGEERRRTLSEFLSNFICLCLRYLCTGTHRLDSPSNPACSEIFVGKVAIVCCHPGGREGGFVHRTRPECRLVGTPAPLQIVSGAEQRC